MSSQVEEVIEAEAVLPTFEDILNVNFHPIVKEVLVNLGLRDVHKLYVNGGTYLKYAIKMVILNRFKELEVTDSSSSEVLSWCK